MRVTWISWLVMVMVTVPVTCVVMSAKSKYYDQRPRMPLLFKIDRNIIVGSNILNLTWLVVWARLFSQNVANRLELLVIIELSIGILAQRWLLHTFYEHDTATYDGPGPLCSARRARRVKLHAVIASLSAGWCAALSWAAQPYTGKHVCGYWFMTVAMPCMYALMRTLLMDYVSAPNISLAHSSRTEITNEFTIEGDEMEEQEEQEEQDD